MFRLPSIAALSLAAMSLACLAAPLPAAAQTTDAILILDASGSMWGQVDGQTKISAAKQAVDSILAQWKPTDRLGLMAYGHRSKGDCKDIELMVPVGTFDPARIKAAVHGLNPKGKTPIADSLREAAKALRSTENKATVILVSDGIDTCAPDPCAVAGELKKSGIAFTAHVIGFDVADPVAKQQLQCIARVTGGIYLDAGGGSGLGQALGRAVAATQGTRVQSEAPAKAEPDPYKGKNIRGVARLAAGLDPISDADLGWSLFKPTPDGEPGDFVQRLDGSPFAGTAEPGDYVLKIEYGQTSRQMKLRVERNKPTQLDVALDAGYVTSEGVVIGGAKPTDATWEVLNASGQWIATEYKPVPRFVLGAGDYILRLTKGVAKTEKKFSVAAGDSINVSLDLDVGKLQVSAVYAPNGPKVEKDLTVEVRQPAKADGQEGEWVATDYNPLSQFDLPGQAYDVVVSVGAAKRVVRAEVKSGAPTRLNVNLDAGVLGLRANGASGIEILAAERDINNERRSLYIGYDPQLNLALSAGAYVAVVGFPDGAKVERPFTVAAGKRVDLEIKK